MPVDEKTGGAAFTVRDLTDEGLLRLEAEYRHQIQWGNPEGRTAREHWLADVRQERLARFRLHMRYRAVDDHLGTDSAHEVFALGKTPTYRLAAVMDASRAKAGRSHVLAWPTRKDS